MNRSNHIIDALGESSEALKNLINNETQIRNIEKASSVFIDTLRRGNSIYSCGNGGSMCDAMHFAEELSGRYRDDRKPLPAISISDPSHISCVSNDYGYDYSFSRYIEAFGKAGDALLAISTSGNSKSVINAAKAAKDTGMSVISLTGREESQLNEYTDMYICTSAGKYADRVQELHIKVIHIFIEMIERSLFPENYLSN